MDVDVDEDEKEVWGKRAKDWVCERAVEIPDIETISAKGDTPLSYRRG